MNKNSLNLNKVVFFYLLLTLILIAGFRPIGFDPDTPGYTAWILSGSYPERAEPAFVVIVDFWKQFLNDDGVPRAVFFTFAFIHIFILKLAIDKYTKYKSEAIILYFLLLYSISTLTQIRIGVASAIFLWAINDIYQKNAFSYFLKIALAITFHSMATIFIFFYFLSPKEINKKIYLLVFPIGIFIWQFVSVFKELVKNNVVDILPGFVGAKVYSYLSIEEQAISTFNLWFLFVVLVYYLVLLKLDKFQDEFKLYVKVIGIGILMYFSFNFISILSIRIMNSVGLLVLILVPALVRVYKPSSLLWVVFFALAFLIFLNWHVRNQLLHFDVLFN